MNPAVISEIALAVSIAAFVSGVLVSAHVINIANEVKAKVEAVIASVESKAKAAVSDVVNKAEAVKNDILK